MGTAVTKEEMQLLKEIAADPKAKELMVNKCNWEQMSWSAVLRDWGDPRTWNSYKEEEVE